MEANSWLDQTEGLKHQKKIWQSVAVIALVANAIQAISTFSLGIKVYNDSNNERLVLVPALQRKLVIPAQSYISNAFVKAAANRVVELQESWSYETIEDHYKELFETYYGHNLSELTRANLTSTDRFNYVRKNRMVSTFEFNSKRSEYSWCKKLKRACALVTGTRRLYINNNEAYSEKEVSFFLLAESIWPTEDHPHALKFSRVKLDDTSDNSYENIKKQFDAAKQGVMLNEG